MFEGLFRSIFGVLFAILCWLLFIPIGFILATPVVLVIALCRREGTFTSNVIAEYQRFWNFWKEWGILMVPPW